MKNVKRTKDQNEDGYRSAMKRIVKTAVGIVDNHATTDWLEKRIKEIAKVAPAVVAEEISRTFGYAAKAWERGNNSGNSKTMGREEKRCDRLRDRAERLLALWNVKVTYPGLYPVFEDKFSRQWYDAGSLFLDISND